MIKQAGGWLAVVCAVALSTLWAAPAKAQMAEVKEKPRMYSYIAFWAFPRQQWADAAKQEATERTVLEKALADGKLVGYGDDLNLVHQPDGATHDDWFSSTSLANILNVLDQFYKGPTVTSPVDASALRHWDQILVSRYYNWHGGSWKDVYTYVGQYKLKADAPDDALDTLAKNLVVPILEKALAEGTIHEYEIDTEAVHTETPGMFYIAYIAANAEGVEKVMASVREAVKANPLSGPAFDSVTDYTGHRDYLIRTNATFK